MSIHPPDPRHATQRFFAPEVIQTSAMDCGPAALKCMLEGFGIPVSYGRLREACQTDVDGTSIDTIEDVARQLGLVVEQVMMPIDHLFLSTGSNLPALVVVQLPSGHPHFLIIWRIHGNFVQIMDPANGRRWLPQQRFLPEVYAHTIPIAAEDWRAWAGSDGFLLPLRQRLQRLGVTDNDTARLLEAATNDDGWFGLARLDAAIRLVAAVLAAKGVQPGAAATALLATLIQQAGRPEETDKETRRQGDRETSPYSVLSPHHLGVASSATSNAAGSQLIPAAFWSVQPLPTPLPSAATEQLLLLQGAVLLRILGRQEPTAPLAIAGMNENAPPPALAPALAAALNEAPACPEWTVWHNLRADGLLTPALLLLAAALATVGVLVEAMLLRGLLDLSGEGPLGAQFGKTPQDPVTSYLFFLVLLAVLEWTINSNLIGLGRRLETRLRIVFLEKLPRLSDRYFHSRLTADMAQRAYGLRQLRELPGLALRVYRTGLQLLLTALGLIWLAPYCAPLALLAVAWSLGCPLLAQWVLAEQDGRIRTYAGALTRFYLDGLLGLIPVRTHAAERALRREHEGVLVHWLAASETFYRSDMSLQALEAIGSTACTVAIVFQYLLHGGEAGGVLLLLYWSLTLSSLGQTFTTTLRQYPAQRNHLLRVLEPLGAPEEGDKVTERQGDKVTERPEAGTHGARSVTLSPPHLVNLSPPAIALRLTDVSVLAGGHTILHNISLSVNAGEHVAIIGASGAGKSSLVGLFLGWHRPATGQVWVNDAPLTSELVAALRQQTAWVDPAVQLWNRSLWENLRYGAPASDDGSGPAAVLEQADLYQVLAHLPHGLQTPLGEGGGLVSGGEGQRVRLGRAMARTDVRLAILDEPLRGLDRTKRRQLLRNARAQWRNATLLCITHDMDETQHFDRVLVMDNGRIVEDGPPPLLATTNSRYAAFLQAEASVRAGMWQGAQWRRLRMEAGQLQEAGA